MFIIIFGIILGIVLGFLIPYTYNPIYSLYVSISILACLDSIVGGIRAILEKNFDSTIFISGFFVNALLAAFLAFLGDKLGVPLYYAAIVTFGGRVFDNFGKIRRVLINKIRNNNLKNE